MDYICLKLNYGEPKTTTFLKLLALTNLSMYFISLKCHAKELKGI